ncbi:MAG: elongation factor G [Lentisphaeria bacterium]
MKNCPVEKIRNFVLAGHAGSGKTSLADLILFKAGVVSRCGSVDNGTSISDFRTEEQERKSSIYSAIMNCAWDDGHLFFCDTPGNTDFCGEAMNAINIAGMMIIVVDAADGVGPGTVRAWKQARDRKMPRAIFINGCDREEANFLKVLDDLPTNPGQTVRIPYNVPNDSKEAFNAIECVLKDVKGIYAEKAAKYKQDLFDAVAESDEDLMMKYLDGEELTPEEFENGFHAAILAGSLVPVFTGSVAKDIGINEMMEAIMTYGPSPLDDTNIEIESGELVRDSDKAIGLIFKSINDSFIGQMNYMRVFSGTFHSDSEVYNTTKDHKERIGNLLLLQGKDQTTVESAGPGEIIAIAKLKNTDLNNVLSSSDTSCQFKKPKYPQPTQSYAIFAAKKGEDDKLGVGLLRLAAEDPTFQIEHNRETHQTIIHGMGDLHINLMIKRLKKDFKVEVVLETPRIPYRETVKGTATAQYRHKKQSGGHGQFAEVHLRIEPFEGTPEEEFQFANEVVGGNIPKNYIPAIEKGVIETRAAGPISRSKVINFKATVYDGKFHDVDSSEMAFKIATRGAFHEAMQKAKPILLEPIMSLKIMFPEEYMGAITGDLNSRRGRILGMDRQDSMQILKAELPLAESYTYSTLLRSMTQGRGSYEIKFERYETVPTQLMAKIQAEVAKQEEEENA